MAIRLSKPEIYLETMIDSGEIPTATILYFSYRHGRENPRIAVGISMLSIIVPEI